MTEVGHRQGRRGFTLVEMAVVLVIIGLIILTVFPALTALRSGTQRGLTQSNLHSLMVATAAYAQANGCLPCPTPATTFGAGFGHVRGDSSAAPAACGACATVEGIPPFISLGIQSALAHDGWGNWITMRVDPALTVLQPNAGSSILVPPFAPCVSAATNPPGIDLTNNVCTAAQNGMSQKGMCRSGISKTASVAVKIPAGGTQQAAVIFVSNGINGYGSFIADANSFIANGTAGCRKSFPSSSATVGVCSAQPSCPSVASCVSGNCAAQCNAAGNNQFIDSVVTDSYTDMLAYADRNTLIAMLGNGACQTVW